MDSTATSAGAVQPTANTPPPCLLCRHAASREAARLTGQQLRALWKALGHEFSPQAWGRITQDFVVSMRQCEACGFIFFDPALAGQEAFYRELVHAEYYTEARPEFARTVRFAQRHQLRRVLDVGCGSGAFLDLAAGAGCVTYGLELNRAAGQQARAKGHRVFDCLVHELNPTDLAGPMDLVTLFQVLEHVADPVQVVSQASALLRSGGVLAVAVPFRDGVYRLCPWDPHQWPPHHVSHWRLTDFEALARVAGLRLRERGGDFLYGTSLAHFWKLHNRVAPVLGKARHAGGDGMARVISQLYRKSGLRFVFPRWGNSIYAFFEKL